MSELVVQPSAKDTYLSQSAPTSNYGLETQLILLDYESYAANRDLLEFSIAGLPAGSYIISAKLYLYYYYYLSGGGYIDPVGKTVWAYKQTHIDWVENQATWNIYKTGSNWSTAGGDYVTSSPAGGSAVFPGSYGWMEFDVTAIADDAWGGSNLVELLVKYETEGLVANMSQARFYSNDYLTDTSKCPKLVIEYEAPPEAPTNFYATTSQNDKVTNTWTKPVDATHYRVDRDGVDISGLLGDVDTWDDETAGPPVIVPGSAVAADGKRHSYVRLSIEGESVSPTEYTYKVKAFKTYTESGYSNESTGSRLAVMDLTYQWQRSAADSDADYTNISGATLETYNDYGAPAYPAARYYRCVIAMTDAVTQTTAADRGYRRRADAPSNDVDIIIKDRDGNTLGHIMNPIEPGTDYRLNYLGSCSFKLPSDELVAEYLVYPNEIWYYVNGELKDIFIITGKRKRR